MFVPAEKTRWPWQRPLLVDKSKHFREEQEILHHPHTYKKEKKQQPRLCQVAFQHYLTFDTVKGSASPPSTETVFCPGFASTSGVINVGLGEAEPRP